MTPIQLISSRTKWCAGSLAFLLPALIGVGEDIFARSPKTNGSASDSLFHLVFYISIFLAAAIPATIVMLAPLTVGRRFGFTIALWCLLIVEVYIAVVWSLRGIH